MSQRQNTERHRRTVLISAIGGTVCFLITLLGSLERGLTTLSACLVAVVGVGTILLWVLCLAQLMRSGEKS